MSSRRRSLSLLELLVVLIIFSFAASLVSWRAYLMWDSYRFHTHCQAIQEKLVTIQLLALTYATDLEFELSLDDGGLAFRNVSLEPILFLRTLELEPSQAIASMKRDGEKTRRVKLSFFHDGWFQPQTLLTFYKGDNAHEIDCRRPLLIKERPLYLNSHEIDE